MRRKTVLGVPVPRSLAKASLPDLDVKSMAKTVGKASKNLGQTTKSVSKDIERVGDQAERIGKILG
jgi:DNA anti-recombination protein RmuC